MFTTPKPKKERPPAPRRIDFELLLCKAIRAKQITDSNPAQGQNLRSFEVGLLNSVVLIEETFQHEGVLGSFKVEVGMNVICAVDRL